MAHGRERGLDGVDRSQMDPMLGRKAVESEQNSLVLGKALNGFGVLRLIARLEFLVCRHRVLVRRRQVYLVNELLGGGLHTVVHLVQDVSGFVHPTALLLRAWKLLRERGPEA